MQTRFMLWEQFIGPSLKAMRKLLSGPSKATGTLLPLVTQTPGWGSQTASTYPTVGFTELLVSWVIEIDI